MSNITIATDKAAPAKVEAIKKPAKRKAATKAKPTKKVVPAKKNAKPPTSERTSKKAEVIAMMKRAGARRSTQSCRPPAGRRTR